jgi:hypothetical protein
MEVPIEEQTLDEDENTVEIEYDAEPTMLEGPSPTQPSLIYTKLSLLLGQSAQHAIG